MSESNEHHEPTKPGTKGGYHCDYCRKDISSSIRIKCAECPDFDLCVDCFACGAAVFPHRADHAYRVMDLVKKPLYTPDWGADEELLLLEAIDSFGMGNWSDVAEHVGSKNKHECEIHYVNIYLSSATAPLPDPTKAVVPTALGNTPLRSEAETKRIAAATKMRAHATSKPKPKAGLGHLVGYIPNRGDFDTEYENDAELTLADMEFKEEDTKWERDLKLKVLEIYNSKLDARIERKKFILERGLLERKEKKRSKEEREVYNNMRVFARFHSAEEHEAFIQGLLNEQRLRKRIEQLQQHRLNGIRTLADGELYELEKKKREANSALNKKPNVYEFPSVGKGGAKKRNLTEASEEDRPKSKKADLKPLSNAAPTSSPSSSSVAASTPLTPQAEWDVSKMPGQEYLSAQEKVLCSNLQLLPQHYMMIKERLIRECFSRGFLKEGQAKQLIKIDVNKTAKIFDFFVSVGWLNTQDLIHAHAAKQAAPPTPAPTAAAKKTSTATTTAANTKPNATPNATYPSTSTQPFQSAQR